MLKKSVRKKMIKYTAGKIGRVRVVKDFLPLFGARQMRGTKKAPGSSPGAKWK
jgi:hypothetical protein